MNQRTRGTLNRNREEIDRSKYRPSGIFMRFSVWKPVLLDLDGIQVGNLLLAAIEYAESGEDRGRDFFNNMGVAWNVIKADIDENLLHYRESVDRRTEAMRLYRQAHGSNRQRTDSQAREGDSRGADSQTTQKSG